MRWFHGTIILELFPAAVKCNDDPGILQTLATLGTGFDCASKAEIGQVLSLGVTPERVIYAHPCKTTSHIRFAAAANVHMTTFDNEPELHKIKALHPAAQLVLRICADDPKAVWGLDVKFGATLSEARHLLAVARELDLTVIGVSFHVGSGCVNADAHAAAISTARHVFDHANSVGLKLTLLDIGGGFPGLSSATVTFEEVKTKWRYSTFRVHMPKEINQGYSEHNFDSGSSTTNCMVASMIRI